jgi:hypothetical protein
MSPCVPIGVFGMQAVLMLVDEFYFHRKRGLPRWERIGHPLDTLTVLACYGMALTFSPSDRLLGFYAAAAVFSCLFITKDEFVHTKACSPGEHWLHSALFVLHPVVLTLAAIVWIQGGHQALLTAQGFVTLVFGVYQILYWNHPWKRPSLDR